MRNFLKSKLISSNAGLWKTACIIFCVIIAAELLSGCFAWRFFTKKREKKKVVLPRILVLPFTCENDKIAAGMTKGFVDNIDKHIEVLDAEKFQSVITSKAIEMEIREQILKRAAEAAAIPPPVLSQTPTISSETVAQIPETALSTGAQTAPPTMPAGQNPYAPASPPRATPPMPAKSTVPPVPPVIVVSSETTPDLNFDLIRKEIPVKEKLRKKFLAYYDIDYVAIGKAKEQVLGDLEIGNLQTAATAQFSLIELKSGDVLINETFTQGLFEIVAPDRIGKKLASPVNKMFKAMRKKTKKKEKEKKKAGKTNPLLF